MLSSLACEGTHLSPFLQCSRVGSLWSFYTAFLNTDILHFFSMITLHLQLSLEIQFCTWACLFPSEVSDQSLSSFLFLYFPLLASFPFLPPFCLLAPSHFLVFLRYRVFLLPVSPCFIFPSIKRLLVSQARELSQVTCPYQAASGLSFVQGQLQVGTQHLWLTNYDPHTNSMHLSAALTATAGKSKDESMV